MVRLIRPPENIVLHVTARHILHFLVLQMKPRIREIVERANMIVMQMRDDHVLDAFPLRADQCQTLDGLAQQHAPVDRHAGVETGVHQYRALGITHQPHVVIHGHRHIVRIATDKVCGTAAGTLSVFNAVNFVGGQHGGIDSCWERPLIVDHTAAGRNHSRWLSIADSKTGLHNENR